MAHWAELDDNNYVLRVLVGSNDDPDEGYQWIVDNLGGRWMQTSYNGNIRKNYAGIGFTYDPIRDAFIPPKPDPIVNEDGTVTNWVLNEDTCLWEGVTE